MDVVFDDFKCPVCDDDWVSVPEPVQEETKHLCTCNKCGSVIELSFRIVERGDE